MASAAATVAVAATDRAGSKGRLNHRCHGSAIGEGVVVTLGGKKRGKGRVNETLVAVEAVKALWSAREKTARGACP